MKRLKVLAGQLQVTPAPTAASSLYDVIIVGAGFSGMYMLHKLRAKGLKVKVVEAGSGVGGTWFWNRYPGARCDVPSVEYSYSFDEELQQDWEWTEMMAAQPEIEKYANHVADRYKLRNDIQFNTRVTSMSYDEGTRRWSVSITDNPDTGKVQVLVARVCVCAVGCLSLPNTPEIYTEATKNFDGPVYHTGLWPQKGVDFTGKRVAVVGTGSSGIQSIPIIAQQAERLYVMQRTPQYSLPAHNHPLTKEYIATTKANYQKIRQVERESGAGIALVQHLGDVLHDPAATLPLPENTSSIAELGPEERLQKLHELGFDIIRAFGDTKLTQEANDIACDMWRQQLAKIVKDPVTLEGLTPRDYPIGCKRQVIDSGFFETFNRDNVTLVDLRKGGIQNITERGIQTEQGHYEADALVFATGFDAMTGPLLSLNITGRGGLPLSKQWEAGPTTYLGLQVSGFPNLFTVTGPGSPSVLSNMMCSIEQHVDWIADCIDHLKESGKGGEWASIEPKTTAQDDWVAHVNEVSKGAAMLTHPACNSWYLGANVSGKPRIFMPYVGGVGPYRKICDEVAAKGYEGFAVN